MVVTLVKAVKTSLKTDALTFSESVLYQTDKQRFVSSHPRYLDSEQSRLRRREFARLDSEGGSVYLDYTGAALYPRSLVDAHLAWLKRRVVGNPHSTSPAAMVSGGKAEEARRAVLEFFDAQGAEYEVVWTANATGGFRIVGETYDFERRRVLIPRDAHNSLNSLARKAQAGGGVFEFIEFDSASTPGGEKDTISNQAYEASLSNGNGLVFFTGQSNITGAKLDMSLIQTAKALGWHVGVDAAALAPSTRISLRKNPGVDFMVISLYKICGYPTGLGALIMRKSMYAQMTKKPTFFGGNIIGITMDRFDFSLVDGPERFEDGTCNFASMSAVKPGLEHAKRWMRGSSRRNRILMRWLVDELETIRYAEAEVAEKCGSSCSTFDQSATCVSSMEKGRGGRGLVRVGGSRDWEKRGFTLPLVFSAANGDALNYRFVIWAAAQENISLRGGPCMCNPGASSQVMQRGLITDLGASSLLAEADVGLVRVSLGPPTNFKDVWRLVHFCRKFTNPTWVEAMWKTYHSVHPTANLANNIDELQALATRKR